ncbi:MAG: porphobilinogen synthase, partial [Rhodomicrobium sp.]|nr:porphobilinogen synthase [Rhodomicrobium sp.]
MDKKIGDGKGSATRRFMEAPELPAPGFPATRLRRLRQAEWSRRMARETLLTANDLIWPLFIVDGENRRVPVASMPGVERLSIDLAVAAAETAAELSIPAIALFPYTDMSRRNDQATEAWNPDNLVCRAVRAVKAAVPDIGILCDVALDPYTSHGHDGLLLDGEIANDETIEALIRQSLAQAEAGCDVLAPSDMMDGRIGAMRGALEGAGHHDVAILSYAAKYASAFYGPFREAAESTPAFGDRRSYQMDPPNRREALREMRLDLEEGADVLMVKPALPYLDVIRAVREASRLPLSAYNVSGEYSAVKAAAANGWLDEARVVRENLLAIRRAGADQIITYHARDALSGG